MEPQDMHRAAAIAALVEAWGDACSRGDGREQAESARHPRSAPTIRQPLHSRLWSGYQPNE